MKVFFIAAIALLFIVFILLTYPRLILLYIKTTKGPFSPAYMAKYKQFFNKNPYGYCIKEDFIDRILPFVFNNPKAAVSKAGKNMLPLKYPFFTTFKKLKTGEGRPLCFQAYNKYGIDFKIIGYPSELYGIKGRSYYYFASGLLFLTEFVIGSTAGKVRKNILGFLSEGAASQQGKPKYMYFRINDDESIYYRDAAFSVIIACMNKNHPLIRKHLDLIGGEHQKILKSFRIK